MVFNPNVPQPNDLLSDSQGDILQNFSAANTSFGINHYPFDNATINNGKHKFVGMPVSTVIPPGLIAGEGTVYSQTANAASQLFYSPDASGNEYQMTRCINASFSSFSTNTVFDGTQPRVTGGWTFLPGGMLMQYGFLNAPTDNDTIKFPVAFTTFGMPLISPVRGDTKDKVVGIKTGSVTTTQFQIRLSGSDQPTGLYWHVIGK